jgi:hypothetical protein
MRECDLPHSVVGLLSEFAPSTAAVQNLLSSAWLAFMGGVGWCPIHGHVCVVYLDKRKLQHGVSG